ncbi:unnamed protein product [Protopolystoma xenopodis]|uniref:Uncharacterized protein n=1 Tax=Protopolystoma xenopodis TaxID=117903 RepID=A0A3S5A0W0_9PLAT|nr:unnamed protein product [Protopolystoma xenopodis]
MHSYFPQEQSRRHLFLQPWTCFVCSRPKSWLSSPLEDIFGSDSNHNYGQAVRTASFSSSRLMNISESTAKLMAASFPPRFQPRCMSYCKTQEFTSSDFDSHSRTYQHSKNQKTRHHTDKSFHLASATPVMAQLELGALHKCNDGTKSKRMNFVTEAENSLDDVSVISRPDTCWTTISGNYQHLKKSTSSHHSFAYSIPLLRGPPQIPSLSGEMETSRRSGGLPGHRRMLFAWAQPWRRRQFALIQGHLAWERQPGVRRFNLKRPLPKLPLLTPWIPSASTVDDTTNTSSSMGSPSSSPFFSAPRLGGNEANDGSMAMAGNCGIFRKSPLQIGFENSSVRKKQPEIEFLGEEKSSETNQVGSRPTRICTRSHSSLHLLMRSCSGRNRIEQAEQVAVSSNDFLKTHGDGLAVGLRLAQKRIQPELMESTRTVSLC